MPTGRQVTTSPARSLLEEVVSCRTRTLGADHIDTTRSEFELGLVLKRLDDLFSARTVQERVLETSDRQYGPDSELSIRAAVNLANTLRALKRYDLELPLHERVVEARRESVGSQHMDFYRPLVDLATVNHNLHNRKLALDLNQIVLEGFELNGVDRRTIMALQFNIVIDLVRLKRARGGRGLRAGLQRGPGASRPRRPPADTGRKAEAHHDHPRPACDKAE